PETLIVQQLGGGTDRLLGRPVDEVRGMSLGDLLGTGPEQSARGIADHGSEPVYLGAIRPDGLDRSLDVTAHRSARTLVIELEPAPARPATASEILAETRRINTRLERASDLHHLCDVAAEEMRRLTGFDRVMVYQFLEDDTGKVVAEARRGDLDPLLNQ